VNQRTAGDFVFFKFPQAGAPGDLCDHVGVYVGDGKTVEGNTSGGTTGSQANGGGVFIRTRPTYQVAAVVRPTYQ
jgi:cell wall-associated NlpC family hydrolase